MSPSAQPQDIAIDTISHLSDPLSETTSLSPLVSLLHLAYQVKSPPRSDQERLISLLKVIAPFASSEPSDTKEHQILIGSYIHYLSPVLNGYAGMEEFEAAVGAFSAPGEFREFWELEGSNLITEFVSDGSQRMVVGSDVPFLKKYVEDTTCRIGLTKERGLLILVPDQSRVGDQLWSIGGQADQTKIRRLGDDAWEEIGDVVVDQLALR